MSDQDNIKLMDTTPGGESRNQYEDVNSFLTPNSHQDKPNFGDDKPLKGDALAADTKARQQTASRKAENREYGETISEHGMGGQTTSAGVPGAEKNEKRGKYDTNDEKEKEQDKARIEQRYGGGSGVGA